MEMNKLNEDKEKFVKEKDKLSKKLKELSQDYEKMKQKWKKYRARRNLLFEQDTKTCKNCAKEYLEAQNFNWSCRTHSSEFGGELWWCCGKSGISALGCKFSKHESKDDLDLDDMDQLLNNRGKENEDDGKENSEIKNTTAANKAKYAKIRCYGCKEMGHKAKDCPRDPNIQGGVKDPLKDLRRLDGMLKAAGNMLGTNTNSTDGAASAGNLRSSTTDGGPNSPGGGGNTSLLNGARKGRMCDVSKLNELMKFESTPLICEEIPPEVMLDDDEEDDSTIGTRLGGASGREAQDAGVVPAKEHVIGLEQQQQDKASSSASTSNLLLTTPTTTSPEAKKKKKKKKTKKRNATSVMMRNGGASPLYVNGVQVHNGINTIFDDVTRLVRKKVRSRRKEFLFSTPNRGASGGATTQGDDDERGVVSTIKDVDTDIVQRDDSGASSSWEMRRKQNGFGVGNEKRQTRENLLQNESQRFRAPLPDAAFTTPHELENSFILSSTSESEVEESNEVESEDKSEQDAGEVEGGTTTGDGNADLPVSRDNSL
ncbi:unnamed protein product [Amoebophrya sp. A120]|nr:unnamed protein product [Amoebophrya sp. A120]|eukprot:GSA120T00009386001.1